MPDALVERAQQGDRIAQEELWRANSRWVAAIVLAHRPRTCDVDDLMQDVAIKLVSKIETLRDPGAFKPWLRQIIINICRGAARSQKTTLRLGDESGEDGMRAGTSQVGVPGTDGDIQGEAVDEHDAASHVLRQVLGLPPEYREPLLLRCVQSLTYQQISVILDLPVTTIETRLARGRRMLREEVGREI